MPDQADEPSQAPLVSVVVVLYNSERLVRLSLEPLSKDPRLQLVMVDNASTDHSVEEVRSLLPSALVVRNEENLGFARAVNIGVERASASYLLLLNPDAFLSPSTVIELIRSCDEEGCAAMAPLVVPSSSETKTIAAGRFPTVWRMFLHLSGLSRLPWHALEGTYLTTRSAVRMTRKREVDWVSGACLLVRRDTWDRVGGLTERWFMYGEDIEFCLRLHRSGELLILDPSIHVEHLEGESSQGVDGKLGTLWLTNLFDLYRTEISSGSVASLLWRIVVISGYLTRFIVFQVVHSLNPKDLRSGRQRDRFLAYGRALVRWGRSGPTLGVRLK